VSRSEESEVVQRSLEELLRAGAAAADAVLVADELLEARVRGTEIDFVKQAREKTLGLRAFVEGSGGLQTAVTSTADLSPAVVERMAGETVALASAMAADPMAGLPREFTAEFPDLDLFEPTDRPVEAKARIQAARAAEEAARAQDERIVNSEGSHVRASFARIAYGNTVGFLGEYEAGSHSLYCEPIARENGSMQRDYWMTVARKLENLEEPAAVGRRAAERALQRLGAKPVATCEVPVIFDPRTAPTLLRQLAQCVNGYSIYRGTSFLAGKLGESIASEGVTIIDDGRLPGGLGSKPFDGEGQATRRNVVVEKGRLGTYLLDTYSARKLDMRSTGSAARGAGSGPVASTTNLWLEPGNQSLDEIIATTPRGLLVTELIGFGFNPVTGDYSRGAAGLWIENGEITAPVDEITIAGNFAEMLQGIDAIASELHWFGAIASPALRISRMTVAGA
jgi:PmbA protein